MPHAGSRRAGTVIERIRATIRNQPIRQFGGADTVLQFRANPLPIVKRRDTGR
jgi:hypothetical protein